MTDLDRELDDRLGGLSLPAAPDSLHVALDRTVQLEANRSHQGRPRIYLVLGLAAVIAAAGLVIASAGGRTLPFAPSPSHQVVIGDLTASPSANSTEFPTETLGLHVYTVSELLSARAAGHVSGGPLALAGYWSYLRLELLCPPPPDNGGVLELRCGDDEYGITERDEPMMVLLVPSGRVRLADGPHLTPYLPKEVRTIWPLFTLQLVNGQPYPPVPIVVVGHLDDSRATACLPAARTLCGDRFVVDQILSFDSGSVPTPGVTPGLSPLLSNSPPP